MLCVEGCSGWRSRRGRLGEECRRGWAVAEQDTRARRTRVLGQRCKHRAQLVVDGVRGGLGDVGEGPRAVQVLLDDPGCP